MTPNPTVAKVKPVQIAQMGVFIMVRYPYRKSRSVLLALKGHNVHCCICDEDIPKTKRVRQPFTERRVTAHILRHDRRKTVKESDAARYV